MVGSDLIWAPPERGRRAPGARNGLFWPQKNPGACFWGRKKPLREARGLTPWFWARTGLEPHPQDQVPREGVQSASAVLRGNPYQQSSPGFEPGASGVHRPCARPLGNLTTVGHLAEVSPDLSPHFTTQKPHFLTSFQRRKIKFSDT